MGAMKPHQRKEKSRNSVESEVPELEELIEKHNRELFLTARNRVGDKEYAEDIVQETWLTFTEKRGQFEGRSSVRSYLFGILRNKIREFWRQCIHERMSQELDETKLEEEFNQKGSWTHGLIDAKRFTEILETENSLKSCVDELQELHRAVFLSKEVEGEDTQEICQSLGITENHLHVLSYRAKRLLRRCLEKKGLNRHDVVQGDQ